MRVFTILLFFLLFSLQHFFAQSAASSEKLLYELSESGFLKRYKHYKTEAEKHVALLKLKEETASEEQKIEMHFAYRETQEAFHAFILDVRNDLLDAKKRRYIKKETELYVENKLLELDEIYQEYYMGKFYPIYLQVCHPEIASRRSIDPSVMVPMIVSMLPSITSTFTKLVDFFDDKREDKLEAYKKLLEEEWVQPNLFPDWEQI